MAELNYTCDEEIDEEPERCVVKVSESTNFKDKMISLSCKKTSISTRKVQESWIDSINSLCLSQRSKKTYSFSNSCVKLSVK